MPPSTSPLQSTRLENLSLDSQGAAFDLEGRPIRLKGEGYASPVASMREFYQHALSDYYQRSAELSRQAAASRPPLLRRMLSWIGRIFERITPGLPSGPAPVGPPPLLLAMPPVNPATAAQSGKESPSPAGVAGPAPLISPGIGQIQKPEAKRSGPPPPLLRVVFADRNGVHVIWHLPSAKNDANPNARGSSDPKSLPPRLELTYGLDSAMAQRLQDCYGQLAQLGYKIAGLDVIRADPEKPAREKTAIRPVATAAPIEPKPVAAEKQTGEGPQPSEPAPAPRKARARTETRIAPPDPARAAPEPPNPSFLPGL
jgi:hypothetical protein